MHQNRNAKNFFLPLCLLPMLVFSMIFSMVLAMLPSGATSGVVFAEETTQQTQEEIEAAEAAVRQASYDSPVDSNSWENWPLGPQVYAASAAVLDIDTGVVLYSKKGTESHYPASITKLLTVLVALENGSLTDTITFSQASVDFLEYGDAQIGMQPGEQITLKDALYAILLASANEVSYAVAENVGTKMGGGYQTFIEEMNHRAEELGCTGSHWVNANGLHDDEHYTTAEDMARITAALYPHPEFLEIMNTYEYTIPATNLTAETRTFQQNHRMSWDGTDYYYEYFTGGKTGYTDQAGTTLVTTADDGNLKLVAVVMADYGTYAYVDTKAMLDYGFQNFTADTLKEYQKTQEAEQEKAEAESVQLDTPTATAKTTPSHLLKKYKLPLAIGGGVCLLAMFLLSLRRRKKRRLRNRKRHHKGVPPKKRDR